MNGTPYDFSPFTVTDVTYKKVDGHDIGLSVITAKTLPRGKHPLAVRFHGGFLVTGSRGFALFFPHWLGEWALMQKCILVNADYRLLPEARGTDILEDIASLWTWIKNDLGTTISHLGLEADLSRVITVGESAGGWCAVQAALLHPEIGVKAVISQYGVLDIKTPHFTEAYEKPILHLPQFPKELLEKHLAEVKEGKLPKVVSSMDPPGRVPLSLSIVQSGRYAEVLGSETELYPMENLERAKTLPTLWLLHGTEDSAVPVEGSKAFAAKVKQLHPDADLLLTLQPGEHGMDTEKSAGTPYIAEGISFIQKAWLAAKAAI